MRSEVTYDALKVEDLRQLVVMITCYSFGLVVFQIPFFRH